MTDRSTVDDWLDEVRELLTEDGEAPGDTRQPDRVGPRLESH